MSFVREQFSIASLLCALPFFEENEVSILSPDEWPGEPGRPAGGVRRMFQTIAVD
jgi:hypothetical protein